MTNKSLAKQTSAKIITKRVRMSTGYIATVRKTLRPNARCMKCGKRFFSWMRSVAYDDMNCRNCGGKGEW